MAHIFPVDTISGMTTDVAKRLVDSSISAHDRIYESCNHCPQITAHNPLYHNFYNKLSSISNLNQMPPAKWFRNIQTYIQMLTFIAEGIPTFGWRYSSGDGNNFIQQLKSYEVVSASGCFATLQATGVNDDPRTEISRSVHYSNIDWPAEGSRWSETAATGCLQQGDFADTYNTVLKARGTQLVVKSVDFRGLTYGGAGTFTIEFYTDVTQSANPYPNLEDPCYMVFYGRVASAPEWFYFPDSHPFFAKKTCEYKNIASVITIDKDVYQNHYIIKIDGVDVSSQMFTEDRIEYLTSSTKYYFGATNWNGDTQTDLTIGKSKVRFEYYYYDSTSIHFTGQRMCSNCRISNEILGADSGVVAYNSGSQYCVRVDSSPSQISLFDVNCNLRNCSQYSENVIPTVQQYVDFFNGIFAGSDWYIQQIVEGFNNYEIATKLHSSILWLLGFFRLLAPYTYRPKRYTFSDGKYCNPTVQGGMLNILFDWTTLSFDNGAEMLAHELSDDEKGWVLTYCTTWLTKQNPYSWSSTANEWERVLSYCVRAGYVQDEMDITGYGEDTTNRGGEIEDILFFTIDENNTGYNHRGTWTKGHFNDFAKSDISGNKGLKLLVNNGMPDSSITKVTGQIYRAERFSETTVRIHCVLATVSIGRNVYGGDDTRNYNQGGNIVPIPDFQKVNNHYQFNQFATKSLARDGDACHFTFDGGDVAFTIGTATPVNGDEQSYIPNSYTLPVSLQLPVLSTTKKPKSAKIQSDNTPLHLTTLSYCPLEDKYTKFYYNAANDNWECQTCSQVLDEEDFESQIKPPGLWEGNDYKFNDDEIFVREYYTDDGITVSGYEIHYPDGILNIIGINYQINITYTDDTTENKTIINNDLQITQEQYDSLTDVLSTVQVYDGFALQDLEYTSELDTSAWSSTLYYSKYTSSGDYYLRFSYQYFSCESTCNFNIPVPEGYSSGDYYDFIMTGMAGRPTNHKVWACKSDTLDIIDEGVLTTDILASMAGLDFTVKSDSKIHDSSDADVWWTEYGVDAWQKFASPVFLKCMGAILIRQSELDNIPYSKWCIMIKGDDQ